MSNETAFANAMMRALSAIDGVRVWRQNVGMVTTRDRAGTAVGVFRAGPPPGACDISGIVSPWGFRLEIECKAWDAKRGKEARTEGARAAKQAAWGAFIGRSGGVWCKVVEPADGTVDAAVRQVRDAIARRASEV